MSAARRARRSPSAGIDGPMQEVLARLFRVLIGCGFDPDALAAEAHKAIRKAGTKGRRPSDEEIACFLAAPHVLTLWHTDPEFLDAQGKPRPLPLTGPGATVEMLASRADPGTAPKALIDHLLRYRGIKTSGRIYSPCGRALSYRGHPVGQHLHGLLVLQGMLRNVEHNVSAGNRSPTWFEYVAENPAVPEAALGHIERELYGQGMPFLNAIDLEMRQAERSRKPKQNAHHVAVGLYFYTDTPRTRRQK